MTAPFLLLSCDVNKYFLFFIFGLFILKKVIELKRQRAFHLSQRLLLVAEMTEVTSSRFEKLLLMNMFYNEVLYKIAPDLWLKHLNPNVIKLWNGKHSRILWNF